MRSKLAFSAYNQGIGIAAIYEHAGMLEPLGLATQGQLPTSAVNIPTTTAPNIDDNAF